MRDRLGRRRPAGAADAVEKLNYLGAPLAVLRLPGLAPRVAAQAADELVVGQEARLDRAERPGGGERGGGLRVAAGTRADDGRGARPDYARAGLSRHGGLS